MMFIVVFCGICILLLIGSGMKANIGRDTTRLENMAYLMFAIFLILFILILIGGA